MRFRGRLRPLRAFFGISKHYDLAGGDRLPAERVLCEELGVSRTALRAAITRLISCGTLESRRGSGTYVCPPKPLNIFQETWNYTQAVERVGSKSTAHLVWSKVVYADIDLAQKAQIDLGMPLFCIRRVRVVNGSPASIEQTAHVNLSLCPSLPDHDFEQESLYDVLLEEGNVHVAHGKEHISISRLNADEAKLLGAQEGTPVFYKASHERDENDGFVEYCKSVILPRPSIVLPITARQTALRRR